MDLTTSSTGRTLLWASLMSDFESIITKFVDINNWSYVDFCDLLDELHFAAIFNAIVQSPGQEKDEHYNIGISTMLSVAKDFWLNMKRSDNRFAMKKAMSLDDILINPNSNSAFVSNDGSTLSSNHLRVKVESALSVAVSNQSSANFPISTKTLLETGFKGFDYVSLKKEVGGFYLLYTIWELQTRKCGNPQLIQLTKENIIAIENFRRELYSYFHHDEENECIMTIKLMFEILFRIEDSHSFTAFEDSYHCEFSTRTFLNTKLDEHFNLLKLRKEVQDELYHSEIAKLLKENIVSRNWADSGMTNKNIATVIELLSSLIVDGKDELNKGKHGRIFTQNVLLGANSIDDKAPLRKRRRRKVLKTPRTPSTGGSAIKHYDQHIFGSKLVGKKPKFDEDEGTEEEDGDAVVNDTNVEQDDDDEEYQVEHPFGDTSISKKPTKRVARRRTYAGNLLWNHYVCEKFQFPKLPQDCQDEEITEDLTSKNKKKK